MPNTTDFFVYSNYGYTDQSLILQTKVEDEATEAFEDSKADVGDGVRILEIATFAEDEEYLVHSRYDESDAENDSDERYDTEEDQYWDDDPAPSF